MTRRIERRQYRLGTADNSDPEKIQELEERREKHARLSGKKPVRTFQDVLTTRMKKARGEDEEEPREETEGEEREALLALHPGQQPGLANKKKVIVKG